MFDEDDYKIIEAMERYGGSFVRALATCFRCADRTNYLKLRATFRNYWLEYEKMAGQKEFIHRQRRLQLKMLDTIISKEK